MATALILAGFVDAHVHYPQTAIIASWGKRLIDWLNTYTFPEEMRFADPAYAAEIAGALSRPHDGPWHHHHVQLLHDPSRQRRCLLRRGARRAASGWWRARPAWTATPPRGCATRPQSAYDDSKALLERWHGVGRLSYVITPRFSPTSTPEQLEALGALWAEHPDCLMQTHLSEQTDEIAWVKGLFPQARDYLDTYEAHGLAGAERALRPCHPPGAARARPAARGRRRRWSIARPRTPSSARACSTWPGWSPRASASGWPPIPAAARLLDAAHHGGGLRDRPAARHRAASGAAAVAGHRRLGRGRCAWASGSATSRRGWRPTWWCSISPRPPPSPSASARAGDIWEAVFPTIMMGDDRAIADVWIGGRRANRES